MVTLINNNNTATLHLYKIAMESILIYEFYIFALRIQKDLLSKRF